MEEDDKSEIMQAINEKVKRSLDTYGAEMVGIVKEWLSVDYPPASQRGEMPARRTGKLQDGIDHAVYEEEGGVVLEFISSREGEFPGVPATLNNELNRPYWDRLSLDVQENGLNTLSEILKG